MSRGPHLPLRPAGSNPIHRVTWSTPNSLLVATIPDLGNLPGHDAENLHAPDVNLRAVLERHRRLVDERDVLAVVTGNHQVQVESDGIEHGPMADDPVDCLPVCERCRLAHLMPDDRVTEQLFGEREVALVPHHEVVE